MPIEQNKAIIRRLTEAYWNQGNQGVLDEAFAPDFLDHTPFPGQAPGREGLKQAMIPFRAAFSDTHSTVDDIVAEGDKVAWSWTFRGTHTGELMGIPATGKQITFTGITIDHIAGNKIVERWSQVDMMGLMQQLGVIPTPG